MIKTLIIECDDQMSSVFLYEAKTVFDTHRQEWISVRGEKIVNRFPTPKFYGILDSLLITKERREAQFANVPPLTPEPPVEVQS